MQARTLERATLHSHEGQTRTEIFSKDLWSALQTHLQGVHGATLAIMPENIRHRAALLSRSSSAKLTRPAKEGKPKPPPLKSEGNHAARLR
jgi:hypothetical protein